VSRPSSEKESPPGQLALAKQSDGITASTAAQLLPTEAMIPSMDIETGDYEKEDVPKPNWCLILWHGGKFLVHTLIISLAHTIKSADCIMQSTDLTEQGLNLPPEEGVSISQTMFYITLTIGAVNFTVAAGRAFKGKALHHTEWLLEALEKFAARLYWLNFLPSLTAFTVGLYLGGNLLMSLVTLYDPDKGVMTNADSPTDGQSIGSTTGIIRANTGWGAAFRATFRSLRILDVLNLYTVTCLRLVDYFAGPYVDSTAQARLKVIFGSFGGALSATRIWKEITLGTQHFSSEEKREKTVRVISRIKSFLQALLAADQSTRFFPNFKFAILEFKDLFADVNFATADFSMLDLKANWWMVLLSGLSAAYVYVDAGTLTAKAQLATRFEQVATLEKDFDRTATADEIERQTNELAHRGVGGARASRSCCAKFYLALSGTAKKPGRMESEKYYETNTGGAYVKQI
jgi:hypothetical protein